MKYIIAAACLLIGINSYAQKKIKFDSPESEKEIVINGIGDEWPQPFSFADEKITYSVCHTNDKLYFLIQSFDRATQQKIMRSGVSILISTKGKEKVKLSIDYPMRSSSANSRRQTTGRPDPEEIKARQSLEGKNLQLAGITSYMKVKGFSSCKGLIPANNKEGINAAILWESESLLTYELALPIEEVLGTKSIEEFKDFDIDLKIQINAIVQPTPRNGNSSSMRPAGGDGRGGRGGGGGRPGATGMSRGGRVSGTQSDMFLNSIYKASFTLSGTN